jgi:hypothetical protein
LLPNQYHRAYSPQLESSSSVHLLARPFVRLVLVTKASRHLLQHCFSVRLVTSAAIAIKSLLDSLPPLLLGLRSCTNQLRFFFWCPATGSPSSHSIRFRVRFRTCICIIRIITSGPSGDKSLASYPSPDSIELPFPNRSNSSDAGSQPPPLVSKPFSHLVAPLVIIRRTIVGHVNSGVRAHRWSRELRS